MNTDKYKLNAFWPFICVHLCSSVAILLLPLLALAAEPTVRAVDVRGLQISGTTTIIVDGDDLGVAPRLLLPFASKQTLKAGSTPKRATFDITLDAAPVPGFYNLRVVSDGGVSLPIGIAVDGLPQRLLTPKVDHVPVALHGALTGSTIVSMQFMGKAGEKVVIEVEAQRLGSKLRPIVHLYDAKRRQVAWAWPKPSLSGDTRLQATLAGDGLYTVSVHDEEYAGAGPGHFRLKLGQWLFVEQVFPPVVGKDRKKVELLGPDGALEVELPFIRRDGVLPMFWPKVGIWSGPRLFVTVSENAEFVAKGDGKVMEIPKGPVGVSGRLLKPFAEARFRIAVEPGSKIRLEAFAERLGSPLHLALVVRNEAGGILVRAEEGLTTLDPTLEYTVPAKVTSILVGVEDSQGHGGPQGVYRMTVSTPTADKPDFRLFTPAQRVTLPVGGKFVFPVLVERRGYLGAVDLTASGLPPGVTVEGARIELGAEGTLVTIGRGTSRDEAVFTGWQGRGDDKKERPVLVADGSLERLQPWLATELPLAPIKAKAADFQIDWRALPADAGLVLAGKRSLPIKVTRPATADTVRLTLVTSQSIPLVNGQPDPIRALRPEKPVELLAKVTDGELTVLVPAELAATNYEVAIQADLLGPDKKTVLATAFTPVQRMAVRLPLIVRIDGPLRIEAKSNPKMAITLKIKGKVERREGLTGDVALTLTGLPPGASSAPITVKATVTDFTFDVVLPANAPPVEVKGVKVSGSAVADPKQPLIRVRSRDVELTLVVLASAK